MKQKPQKLDGFTLIEVSVSIFVFAMIAIGLITLVSSILSNSQKQETLLYNASQARRLTFKIMEEIREATQSNAGAYPLATTEDNQLIFFTNLDGGSDIERVRYFIQSGTLRRGVVKPTGVPLAYNMGTEAVAIIQQDVANDGATPLFYYYDDTYNGDVDNYLIAPVDLTDVRYIKMDLKIFNKGGVTNTSTYTITTSGALRNLKTNLDE